MIDKNEMRIGNYFIGEDKVLWLSQIRHAENVKEWSYKGWHEETKQRIEVNFFDAEPIPLTTKILEKCGFELFADHGILKCFCITIDEQSEVELLITIGQQYPYMELPGWQNQNKNLQSLHQLQNLVYALTQKELEIKL